MLNSRSLEEEKLQEHLRPGVEGGSIGPPAPSTFDTIHPTDMKTC